MRLLIVFILLSYWIPEANADSGSNDMAYYFGGFLFLQDMVDQALIGLMQINNGQTDINSTLRDPRLYLGTYLQEFPYPCYTYDE